MARPTKHITRARAQRIESSRAERAVWTLLRDRRLADFKFRRQHPIGPFVVDFACVARKLVIELDGPSHGIAEQQVFDAQRTAYLNSEGWRVVRVLDGEVLSDPSRVCLKLVAALAEASRDPLTLPSPPLGGEG